MLFTACQRQTQTGELFMLTFCIENFTLEGMSKSNDSIGRLKILYELVIYTIINEGKALFKVEDIFLH